MFHFRCFYLLPLLAGLALAPSARASMIASDSASNYTSSTFPSSNLGDGFGPWTDSLSPSGTAALTSGDFSIGDSGTSTASNITRSLTGGALSPGQSFEVTTWAGGANRGATQGFSLEDSSGAVLFNLYVPGGTHQTYYTDASSTGAAFVGVPFNFGTANYFTFTLLDANGDYQLNVLGPTGSGKYAVGGGAGSATLDGRINNASGISQVMFFYDAAPTANTSGADYRFDNLAVVPEPATGLLLAIGAGIGALRRAWRRMN